MIEINETDLARFKKAFPGLAEATKWTGLAAATARYGIRIAPSPLGPNPVHYSDGLLQIDSRLSDKEFLEAGISALLYIAGMNRFFQRPLPPGISFMLSRKQCGLPEIHPSPGQARHAKTQPEPTQPNDFEVKRGVLANWYFRGGAR